MILISYFVFEITHKSIKKSLILFLTILTIGNQFTETNVKQFFEKRDNHKPNFSSMLNEINNSEFKNYFIQTFSILKAMSDIKIFINT